MGGDRGVLGVGLIPYKIVERLKKYKISLQKQAYLFCKDRFKPSLLPKIQY